MREYDFIIYGASGVTAKRVIATISKYNVKVALSGRNTSKITFNPRNYPVIQCSTENIDEITNKTLILLNCAGPYILCGESIVQSCIENNCHYIDITGETEYIKNVIEKYDEMAKQKNIYILQCAGFDSLPCDISFDLMKRKILSRIEKSGKSSNLNDQYNSIEIWNYLKARNFKINYATWESLIYGLSAYFKKPKKIRKAKDRALPKKFLYSKERNTHCAIFMGTDHSVVTRSQKAFHNLVNEPIVRFYIYVELGSFINKIMFIFFFSMIMLLIKSETGKSLLLKYPGFFTFGIVKKGILDEEIRNSSFQMNIYGYYENNKNEKNKIQMKVEGPDPGYITTPVCMVESGMMILDKIKNSQKLEHFDGGVLTPAMVFRGTDLIEKLSSQGLKIKFN